MSEFSAASFPDNMPASELRLAPNPLDTRRARRAQREVDAALDFSEANPLGGAAFMDETPTGVVFSDESGGAHTRQGLM